MKDPYNSTQAKSINSYYGYAPEKITRGKGCYLFNNNDKYLDCGMALGSVSLGYAYDEVDNAVIETIRRGVNFSRPSSLEEQLTVLLCEILGNKFSVKYSKSSSMLLTIVPRVSRYLTGKTHVAFPYNGAYLGNTDWFFSQSKNSGGILQSIKDHTITFEGGSITSLYKLFDEYSHLLACIIMEPFREKKFEPSYYKVLSELCRKNNVLLIFDETVSGFRFGNFLAQMTLGCSPNFTIVGKAIANGYALSAILGEPDVMKAIEIASEKGSIYGFSNTHAGESIGLAAAIKTIGVYEEKRVIDHINTLGKKLMQAMKEAIQNSELNEIIRIVGQPTYFHLSGENWNIVNKVRKDVIGFFYQRGILFKGTISISLSHTNAHIEQLADTFLTYCNQAKISKIKSNN